MANLAIRGHATRGKEVIEILEMLGGKNKYQVTAIRETYVYFMDGDTISSLQINQLLPEQFIVFTLEQFEEKFPYKVGDKVQHKGATSCGSVYEVEKIRWVNNDVEYTVKRLWYNNCHTTCTAEDLQPYKEETMEERQYKELRMPLDDDDKLATEVTIDGNKILPPNGYLIGKITQVDNGMLVEYVKQQPQYPKTYEECCGVLDILGNINIEGYKKELLLSLQQLLICRDAYWKIAGKQMGLGKSWKPDWLDTDTQKFCIYYVGNEIEKTPMIEVHKFLAFPTKEMRDAFYENFKEFIETVKELL